MEAELTIGRRIVKAGDEIEARLPAKKNFSSGHTFVGWDPAAGLAVILDAKRRFRRHLPLSDIRPKPAKRT